MPICIKRFRVMPICVMPTCILPFQSCYAYLRFAFSRYAYLRYAFFYILTICMIPETGVLIDAFTIWKLLYQLQRIAFCHRYTSILNYLNLFSLHILYNILRDSPHAISQLKLTDVALNLKANKSPELLVFLK